MSKIYTKTGDGGTTSLVGGERVSKCCERLESYGMTDELNSHIGFLLTYIDDETDRRFLLQVQSDLFRIGAWLATPHTNADTDVDVSAIELEIDRLASLVTPQRSFILPGGCPGAAFAHICRTVCRRTERAILRLQESGAYVDDTLKCYINRLSDYFFVLARKKNADKGISDTPWGV